MEYCTSVFVAAGVNDCLVYLSCHVSWKKLDQQTEAMWSAMVSRSIWTPRLSTAVTNCNSSSSNVPFRNVCAKFLFSCGRLPTQMICILSHVYTPATMLKKQSTLSKQHSTLLPKQATMSNESIVKTGIKDDKISSFRQSQNKIRWRKSVDITNYQ